MESCILIPEELSLVLRNLPAAAAVARDVRPGGGREAASPEPGRPQPAADSTTPDHPASGPLEMTVTVWANKSLRPGHTLLPEQGKIRLETLEVYSLLPREDVRFRFGCTDEIHEVEDEEVRHCNWVRFLKSSRSLDRVNLVALHLCGQSVFQVIRHIEPNTELCVYFEEKENESVHDDIISCPTEDAPVPQVLAHSPPAAAIISRSPLALSNQMTPDILKITPQRFISSQYPHRMMVSQKLMTSPQTLMTSSDTFLISSQPLMTSPSSPKTLNLRIPSPHTVTSSSEKDDDVKSVKSDGTCASDESQQSSKSGTSCNMSFGNDARLPSMGLTPTLGPPPGFHLRPPISTSRLRLLSAGMMSSPDVGSPLMTSEGDSPMKDDIEAQSTPKVPVRRNRERTWLPCEVCGKKFDRPSLLRRHMRTHTGEKPHACDVCGKAFSTSSSLNTHRRIHSGEKPHQCPVCGKRFTASSNLYYHRMTHNKEKPHKCNLCSKSFPTPGDLKSHMYVHNGSWPYKCDICNRGFSKQTNLKNHMLLHSGDKPHECDLCGKKFALHCNLKTHLKTHEGESQEDCFKCGKQFLTSSNQLISGYCRPCLSSSNDRKVSLPRPSPQRRSFSIESLATSSRKVDSHQMSPLDMTSQSIMSSHLSSHPHMDARGLYMLNHPSNMASVPVPVHPQNGSALLHYSGGLTWPKLVPPHY